MNIISIIDERGTLTRMFIGCDEIADDIAVNLALHNLVVIVERGYTPEELPQRSKAEQERASGLLQLLTLAEVKATH